MNTLNSVLEGSVLTGMLFFSFYVIAGELLSVLIRIGSKYRTYAVILNLGHSDGQLDISWI